MASISNLHSFLLWLLFLATSILVLQVSSCRSWNFHANNKYLHHNTNSRSARDRTNHLFSDEHPQHEPGEPASGSEIPTSRRRLLFESVRLATASSIVSQLPANAYNENDPNSGADAAGIVTVRLESPGDSLGVEIYDTTLRGRKIVAIRRIVAPNKNNRLLREGMILRPKNGGSYTSMELVERLRAGPYPLEIRFANLAAGGDAISDLGTSIVTPKDALDLAQQTESNASAKEQYASGQRSQTSGRVEYSIATVRETRNECAIQSRRNDVLEIEYEASYVEADTGKKVIYDASAFRGTGNRPYQMVLGSGDVIPGVDQGLYDMCPGEKRVLTIPPVLGHGPNSRKLYRIPDDHRNLEWEVGLVTIDSTIREDNNVVSRDERESRFAY